MRRKGTLPHTHRHTPRGSPPLRSGPCTGGTPRSSGRRPCCCGAPGRGAGRTRSEGCEWVSQARAEAQTPGGCQRRLLGRHAPAQGVAAVWAAGRQGAGRAGGVRCGGSRWGGAGWNWANRKARTSWRLARRLAHVAGLPDAREAGKLAGSAPARDGHRRQPPGSAEWGRKRSRGASPPRRPSCALGCSPARNTFFGCSSSPYLRT